MPRPTPGSKYTVVEGDNLSNISTAAYGTPVKWRTIWKANKSTLRSDDPNKIYPGEILFIPGNVEVETIEKEAVGADATRLPDKSPDDFTVVVGGREIPCVDGVAFRAIDTCADGFTALIPWNPTRETERAKDLKELLKPYSYPDCECYLGGELMATGRIYTMIASIGERGVSLELQGWGYTADLVDSTVRPPYEAKKITLEQRALDLIEGFAIPLDFQLTSDDQFDRVTIQPTETIFSHLLSLAQERKALVTSNAQGGLVITRANVSGGSVFTLEEGRRPFASAEITFDGRARYNTYEAISMAPRKKGANKTAPSAIAKDNLIPATRKIRFSAGDVRSGNVQDAANWERSRRLADALSIRLPVDGWQIPGTPDLWKENTIVTLQSTSLFVPDGFEFLIRSVEYGFSSRGAVATLDLVPPQVYTGGQILEPWV